MYFIDKKKIILCIFYTYNTLLRPSSTELRNVNGLFWGSNTFKGLFKSICRFDDCVKLLYLKCIIESFSILIRIFKTSSKLFYSEKSLDEKDFKGLRWLEDLIPVFFLDHFKII